MERHLSPNGAAPANGQSPAPRLTIRADQTMDPFMSTPPFPHLSTAGVIPSNLATQASQPNAEPCDIAESAMPDLVFGDLAPADEAWVRDHTMTCKYCANILDSLENVCASLDECDETMAEATATRRPPTTFCLGIPEARYGFMETPVGDVLVAASDQGVVEVSYLANHSRPESLRDLERRGYLVYERQDAVRPVIDQLDEYFAHRRNDFDVPVDVGGVTDFTRSVLSATYRIPYGKVRTYGDIAGEIGKPKASRAVGNALGRNPIPVIIPCHRVVLASGAMGWYTGGPEIKRTLLGIEGVKYAELAPSAQPVLGLEI
jgi:methylated-DNA-[protein]-cysteine S-methyltransferase